MIKIFQNQNLPNDYKDPTKDIIDRIKKRNLSPVFNRIDGNHRNIMVKRHGTLRFIIANQQNNNWNEFYILAILRHQAHNQEENYEYFNENIRNNTQNLTQWVNQRINKCEEVWKENIQDNTITGEAQNFLNQNIEGIINLFENSCEICESGELRKNIINERAGILHQALIEFVNNNQQEQVIEDIGVRITRYTFNINRQTYQKIYVDLNNDANLNFEGGNHEQQLTNLISRIAQTEGTAYPDFYLASLEDWRNIRSTPGISLSIEEENIIRKIIEANNHNNDNKGTFPILIEGRAGSGKTLILQYSMAYFLYRLYKLQNQHNNTTIQYLFPLYCTKSEKLLDDAKKNVKKILEKVSGNDTNLNAFLEKYGNMCFKTYTNLISEILNNEDMSNIVEFGEFKQYYQQHFGQNPQYRRNLSAMTAWYVINAYILGRSGRVNENTIDIFDSENYSELPDKRRTVSDEVFNLSYQVYNAFRKYCRENNKELFQDKVLKALNKVINGSYNNKFGAIICDEAQDFTKNDFEIFLRLSYFYNKGLNNTEIQKVPYIFAADQFQTINPTGFSWEEVKSFFYESLFNGEIPGFDSHYYKLTTNYRSYADIVDLANSVIQVRTQITGERADKQLAFINNNKRNVFLTNSNIEEDDKFKRNATDVIVITYENKDKNEDKKDKNNEKQELNIPNSIETPETAKGLEFARVLVYNFSDFAPNMENNWEFKQFMNKLYVALTRAKKELYIADRDCEKIRRYLGQEQITVTNNPEFNTNDQIINILENIFEYLRAIKNTDYSYESLKNGINQINILIESLNGLNDIKTNHKDIAIKILNYLKSIFEYYQLKLSGNLKEVSNFIRQNANNNWEGHLEVALRNITAQNNHRFFMELNEKNSFIKDIEKYFLSDMVIYGYEKMEDINSYKNIVEKINIDLNIELAKNIKNSLSVFKLTNYESYPQNEILNNLLYLSKTKKGKIYEGILEETIKKFKLFRNFETNFDAFSTFIDFVVKLSEQSKVNLFDEVISRFWNNQNNLRENNNFLRKLNEYYKVYPSSNSKLFFDYIYDNNPITKIDAYSKIDINKFEQLKFEINDLFIAYNNWNAPLTDNDIEKFIKFIETNKVKISQENINNFINKIAEEKNFNYDLFKEIEKIFPENPELKRIELKFLNENAVYEKIKNLFSQKKIDDLLLYLEAIKNSTSQALKEKYRELIKNNIQFLLENFKLQGISACYENLFDYDNSLGEEYYNKKINNRDLLDEEELKFVICRMAYYYGKSGDIETKEKLLAKYNYTEKDINEVERKIKEYKIEKKDKLTTLELNEKQKFFDDEKNKIRFNYDDNNKIITIIDKETYESETINLKNLKNSYKLKDKIFKLVIEEDKITIKYDSTFITVMGKFKSSKENIEKPIINKQNTNIEENLNRNYNTEDIKKIIDTTKDLGPENTNQNSKEKKKKRKRKKK